MGRWSRLVTVAATTAATTAGCLLLLRLAAWQWDRARSRGALLHYTYAVEWLVLAVALVVGVVVVRRRAGRGSEGDPHRDVHGRLIGPPLRAGEELDEPTGVRLQRWLTRRGG